jgi:protein SCO1/2
VEQAAGLPAFGRPGGLSHIRPQAVYNASMFTIMLCSLLCAADAPASRLAVIRAATDFQLTGADEQPVTLHQFKGKVVLVGFFFTTCNGACPATTARLAKIQEALAKQPALKDRVQLISISLDPERDTPEKLRGYLRLYDVDSRSWSFVTGAAADVRRTLARWDMWAKPAANGQLDHPSRVFLVDPQGRIREIYNLDFLRVQWVVEDVQLLVNEP